MRKEKLEELKNAIQALTIVSLEKEEMVKKEEESEGFLQVEKYRCCLENGKTFFRDKLLKKGKSGNATVILPITEEGNVILTIQPRVFTKEKVSVELPAGYIEDEEDAYTAAKRELEEETGYQPKELKKLISYYQDQGCAESLITCFYARDCKKIGNQHLDKDEYIDYYECSYEELLELMQLGYIKDAGSLLTITTYQYQKCIRRENNV